MKEKLGSFVKAVTLIAALFAMFGIPFAMAQPIEKDYTVLLNPNAPSTVLASGAQGHNAAGKGNGWIGYGVDQRGWTTFWIVGQPPNKTCEDYEPKGPDLWVITKLQVSGTGQAANQKGTWSNISVDDFVWKSFPLVNRNSGILFQGDKTNSYAWLQVYNYNAHKSTSGEKYIYYRLELTRCGDEDPQTIDVDPAWGNSGRN